MLQLLRVNKYFPKLSMYIKSSKKYKSVWIDLEYILMIETTNIQLVYQNLSKKPSISLPTLKIYISFFFNISSFNAIRTSN